MIRDTPAGSQIFFLDADGFHRSGELLRVSGGQAAIQCGGRFVTRPVVDCYANEADVLRRRAERLATEIAIRQEAHARVLHRLTELAAAEECDAAVVVIGPCCILPDVSCANCGYVPGEDCGGAGCCQS